MNLTKICIKCRLEKNISDYNKAKNKDGLNNKCKSCIKEYTLEYNNKNKQTIYEKHKQYRHSNKEYFINRGKEYREKNKSRLLEYGKEYREKNKEILAEKAFIRASNRIDEIREYQRNYVSNRRKKDALFNISINIRRLISLSIQKQGYTKKSKTHEILGCSFEEFKAHIENQFVEDMSWNNRHLWHIDHIYPVSKAVDEDHLIKLNHYSNLRPLWIEDNLKKGNKIL